jgi:hypothetical protein
MDLRRTTVKVSIAIVASSLRLLKKYPEIQALHLDFSKDFETALAAMLAGSTTLLW